MPKNSFRDMRRLTIGEKNAIEQAVKISAERATFAQCHFCGEYPMAYIGEPFPRFFGVPACEWCWESDEYMDWSEQKCKEHGIPLDGKTWLVSDETAQKWREQAQMTSENNFERLTSIAIRFLRHFMLHVKSIK